jgi:non-heme chloroperoxidase
LVLEASPTALGSNANLIQFVESVVANLTDPIDPEFARSFVTDTSSENVPPELVDGLVEDVLEVPARVWKETFAGLLEYDDVAELSMIEAPTLLVWGDADVLVTRAMQDQLASTIPNAELAVYEGIGHTPRWEQPARFAEDVTRFVRQVVERS